ncbi:hypothetical protein D9M68_971670 [compost metagenome]
MGENALFLNIQLRVVDHQCQDKSDQEQDRRVHDPHYQRDHDRDHQQQVHVCKFRPLVRGIAQDLVDVAITATAL